MAQKYPVQSYFKVVTPSLSVTIRADDTPLPSDVPLQTSPANLVTVSQLESRESRAPRTEDSESVAGSATPPVQIFKRQQSKIDEHVLLSRQEELAHTFLMRSQSKHADALYSKPNAPPPVQTIEGEFRQVDKEGLLKRLDTYSTKDYTFWDKLKRKGTETEIRRWHTYMPEDVEETAFYGRNMGLEVPAEAQDQGVYFEQLENEYAPKEYELPTESYVAPAVFIRQSYARRPGSDPIQRMVQRVGALLECCR